MKQPPKYETLIERHQRAIAQQNEKRGNALRDIIKLAERIGTSEAFFIVTKAKAALAREAV